MLKLAVLLLVGLVVLSVCAPAQEQQRRIRRNLVRGRPLNGFVPKPKPGEWASNDQSVQGWYTAKLDHFSNTSTATWQQQYWYNQQWYKAGGPAFLMFGGEGPESSYWVDDGGLTWTSLAKQAGAMVFLLEHRFYGASHPTTDMSTANLKYLSSAQAIEDGADFMRGMATKFPQLSGVKWVTFGGSYSGALAAWARIKHPELVSMAVGSSGPVQAEVDFVEYLEVVQASIGRSSMNCANSVAASMAQVAQLIQTASGRQTLKTTFDLCEAIDPNDDNMIKTFWETVYGPYMETCQYSGDGVGVFAKDLTVDHAICRYHNNNATSYLTKLKQVNTYFNQVQDYFGCNDIRYQPFIDAMKDTTYGEFQSDRAWVWQTCTEFGYYQSTDSATAGPFWGGINQLPVKYYVQQCSDIYGAAYNSAEVNTAVTNTNNYYGGRDNIVSDHIVFPNGNVDPWHALGKLNSNVPTLVPVVIDGTAHCADMYAPAATDPPTLAPARAQITSTIMGWLNGK